MAKLDVTKLWATQYRLVTSVITEVAPALREINIEVKELFLLSELDSYPNPAALAEALLMPKPTVTMYVKRLEAIGFVKREIDSTDLRKHKLSLTPEGRKYTELGLKFLANAFGARMKRLTAAQQTELKAMLEKML